MILLLLFLLSVKTSLAQVNTNEIINLTNKVRIENHLSVLTVNDKLTSAAQLKANDMVKNNYWSHVSPTGITPWYWIKNTGYRYLSAGENLAKGYSNSETVINAWMNSPTHKQNLLSKKYCQIGVAESGGVVVEMMACPKI